MPIHRLNDNPIKTWLTIIIGVFVLTAVGIVVFTVAPQSMGVVYEPLSAEASFTFDEWEIAMEHGTLSYPQGGTAVEAFQHGRLSAMVILGSGEFILTPPGDDVSEFSQEVSTVILFMSPDNLSEARGSTVIKSDIYADAMYEAQQMLNREGVHLPSMEMLGSLRHYPQNGEAKRLVILNPQGQRSTYNEGLISYLFSPYENKVFVSPQVRAINPPIIKALVGCLAYLIMLALLATTAYFLTLDLTQGKSIVWPKPAFALGLVVAFVQAVGLALISRLQLEPIVLITWYLLITAALLYLANLGDLATLWRQVRERWASGLLTGGLLAALGMLLGALTLPKGLGVATMAEAGFTLLYGLVWVGVAQEVLWRGIIQSSLCSRFGVLRGLLLTAVAAGVISLLGAVINPVHAGLVFLEALIIVPGRALLLGFVYQRSNNIVAPITLAALLYILPGLLVF